jgi:hypothetical protein
VTNVDLTFDFVQVITERRCRRASFLLVTGCIPLLDMSTPRPAKDRKTIAIKLQDGEPLTRLELQYDFLHHLFSNNKAVFTDPNPTIHQQPARTKVTFRDLYLNTLLHSPKCSRGPREKALENPEFGTEFAKIALLTNAGRINTTMACKYPVSWYRKLINLLSSLPTDADCTEDISPGSFVAED